MAVISGVNKQPSEVVRQKVDYSYWLDGVLIQAVAVSIGSADDPDLLLTCTTMLDLEQKEVSLFISGGLDGCSYTITVWVTLYDGQVREDELKVRVKEIV